jgi:hypothetical protein
MPQTYVKRVTLFKVPKPEDVDQASDQITTSVKYRELTGS